jgi:Domain of unknown function (DUF4956)
MLSEDNAESFIDKIRNWRSRQMEEVIRKISSILLKGFGSQKMEDVGFLPFLMLLVLALLSSIFISYLYLKFYKNRATGSQIHRAFPLLGVAITAIFICIQFSLPLSLGLLGALSIVRFRTPIKEPEEIGFIMVVVASSISCATFNILFLGIILVVTYLGLILLKHGPRFLKGQLNDGILLVTLPSSEYHKRSSELFEYIGKKLPGGKIESISDNSDESVISYSFKHLDNEAISRLQNEFRIHFDNIHSNIYFNRIGDI